jgi:hypothetical protein
MGGIAIVVFLLWLKFGGSWTIESCIDSGGYWDESTQVCRR